MHTPWGIVKRFNPYVRRNHCSKLDIFEYFRVIMQKTAIICGFLHENGVTTRLGADDEEQA